MLRCVAPCGAAPEDVVPRDISPCDAVPCGVPPCNIAPHCATPCGVSLSDTAQPYIALGDVAPLGGSLSDSDR